MTVHTTLPSPLGDLLLVGDESATAPGGVVLRSLSMPAQRGAAGVPVGSRPDRAAFAGVARELTAYFAGEPVRFDVAYAETGSAFRRRVWRALAEIPRGTTATYGEVTRRAGLPPSAVRAVAAAVGANPLPILRPCHRVIGADGSLTGYAAGLERKRALLALEGVVPREGGRPGVLRCSA